MEKGNFRRRKLFSVRYPRIFTYWKGSGREVSTTTRRVSVSRRTDRLARLLDDIRSVVIGAIEISGLRRKDSANSTFRRVNEIVDSP